MDNYIESGFEGFEDDHFELPFVGQQEIPGLEK